MSVTDEQQGSRPAGPSGSMGVFAQHAYNPASGKYEPLTRVPPDSAVGVSAGAPGAAIMLVPATVNARWVYAINVAGGLVADVITLIQLVGVVTTNKYALASPVSQNASVVSTPDAPLFTLAAGSVLVAVSTGGAVVGVTVTYVDK